MTPSPTAETGLLNEAYFRLRLEEEFKKSWRFQWSYSLVLVDVDGARRASSARGPPGRRRPGARHRRRDPHRLARRRPRRARLAPPLRDAAPRHPADGARTMVQRVMARRSPRSEERVTLSVGLTAPPRSKLASRDEFFARAETALHMARAQGTQLRSSPGTRRRADFRPPRAVGAGRSRTRSGASRSRPADDFVGPPLPPAGASIAGELRSSRLEPSAASSLRRAAGEGHVTPSPRRPAQLPRRATVGFR